MPQVPVAYTQFHRFGIAKKCSQVAICFTTVLLQFEFKRQRVCNYEILREKKTYRATGKFRMGIFVDT